MKIPMFIMIILSIGLHVHSQTNLDVDGKVNISTLAKDTISSANVVWQADSTLAIRQYQIGDFVHGGIIFWLDNSGEHGLVCAKQDQSAAIRWHAGSLANPHALGDGPFSGEMNTTIIIAGLLALGDDGNTYAARICAELQVTEGNKSYGDWYLPSKDELNQMFINRGVINTTAMAHGGSGFADFFQYWSSTEAQFGNAWSQQFPLGTQQATGMGTTLHVRAIRAF